MTGDYPFTTTCLGQVAANSSCTITVTFTPIGLGTRPGTLTVTSASSLNPTVMASLTGVGVASVQASALYLNFGNVDVTADSAPQAVTLTNNTAVPVPLSGITVTGEYSATNTCAGAVPARGMCTIAVVFKPSATGLRTGVLTITTSGTTAPAMTVMLNGNGVDFAIVVAPASGNVIAGLSVSAAATLTPLAGYNAPVTMSCVTAASGTACNYSATAITLTTATADPLTITTTSKYTVIGYGALLVDPEPRLLCEVLGLFGVGALLAGRRRASLQARLLVSLLLLGLLAGGLYGCSGKLPDLNSPYTAPGNYTVQVTATDGVVTHTAAYALSVSAK